MKLEKFLDSPINKEGDSIETILEEKEPSNEELKKGLMGFFNNIIENEHIDMSKYEDDRISQLIKRAESLK